MGALAWLTRRVRLVRGLVSLLSGHLLGGGSYPWVLSGILSAILRGETFPWGFGVTVVVRRGRPGRVTLTRGVSSESGTGPCKWELVGKKESFQILLFLSCSSPPTTPTVPQRALLKMKKGFRRGGIALGRTRVRTSSPRVEESRPTRSLGRRFEDSAGMDQGDGPGE